MPESIFKAFAVCGYIWFVVNTDAYGNTLITSTGVKVTSAYCAQPYRGYKNLAATEPTRAEHLQTRHLKPFGGY